MDALFKSHRLNEAGMKKAQEIGSLFDELGLGLAERCPTSREYSLARTHLEQACFYAKKAVAQLPENQELGESFEMRARKMFEAYNAEGPNPWKTYDGKDVPKWDNLNDQVRAKWIAAAAVNS